MTDKQVRVRAREDRFLFDGDTGILVLAGTPGTVEALTLEPSKLKPRDGISSRLPRLTVSWDYALVQDKANDEPTVTEMWQESELGPADVEHIGMIEVPRGA